MLRYITRLIFIFALTFFASGVVDARIQIRAPQNDSAGQNIAPRIFSETVAILRHLAASQAAELQQEKSSRGYDFAPASPLAAESRLPSTLYHYTGEGNAASILKNGLTPGRTGQVFATSNGSLTPIQAQIELGLSPNRGLPGALLKIDASGLEGAGIKPIFGPSRVLPTPTSPGGGIEFIFDRPIPPEFLQRVR